MPATSYPAALRPSRTRLRNFTASSICAGYDFASIVTKPVMARTLGLGRSAPRSEGKANQAKRMSGPRMRFECPIVLAYSPLHDEAELRDTAADCFFGRPLR